MAVFVVVCGAVHAAAHASQPMPVAVLEMSSASDDTSSDNGLNVEVSNCQFCGAIAVPAMAVTPAKDAPAARLIVPRSYDIVQGWKNSDPPPPKS
jgi:hypothetical protein